MSIITCIPKILTPAQEIIARRRSLEINPANGDFIRPVERRAGNGERRLALLIGNRWPVKGVRLSVQFLDNPSTALRKKLLLHMNAWNKTANVRFEETGQMGHVRLARSDDREFGGYWSYVGTQILAIEDPSAPTMNLEGFTLKTPDSEFHRVVRHEAGHTLGFDHEHMRSELVRKIDVKKAIAYFSKTDGWKPAETREQVLTPLTAKSIMGTTEADPTSVMCYQIPGEITKDGKPIPGGVDINEKDYAFAGKIYPKTGSEPPVPVGASGSGTEDRAKTVQRASVLDNGMENGGRRHEPELPLDESDTFHIVVMDEFDPKELRLRLTDCNKQNALLSGEKAASSKIDKNPRFARIFASYGGARVTCAMRLRHDEDKGEAPTPFGNIIRVHEQIKRYTNRDNGSLPDDESLKDFGKNLFDALLPEWLADFTMRPVPDSATGLLI